jgi:hypothetical protein
MVPSCTSDKSCICGIVQKTHAVAIFDMKGYITPCSTYTALVVCTGRHHLIHVVHIQLLSFVQDDTIEHGLNGAVLYKRKEQYIYYMDSMVPSCTNEKSCICTTWIKWCRPVQTTRAVYVLHGLNGAVLYKRQEQYMYCMDSQDGTIESMWYIYSSCRLYRTAAFKHKTL